MKRSECSDSFFRPKKREREKIRRDAKDSSFTCADFFTACRPYLYACVVLTSSTNPEGRKDKKKKTKRKQHVSRPKFVIK